MLTVRSPQDVEDPLLPPEVRQVALDAYLRLVVAHDELGVPYDPDRHGPVLVLAPDGDDAALRELLGGSLRELLPEAVDLHDGDGPTGGVFEAVVVLGNSCAATLVVADSNALPASTRGKLLDHLPEGGAPRWSSLRTSR